VERFRPPADPTDPADAGYYFSGVDNLVRLATEHRLTPLLRISSAPSRHEGPDRWPFAPPGSWDPDPLAYGQFAEAAARRYSGRFPDPLHPGRFLPRVTLWQAWNEPNLPLYLEPQWVVRNGTWVPWSPDHYRRMLNSLYAGVKAVDPANVVVSAGTAPNGSSQDGYGRMAPVRFWQAALCLGTPPRLTLEPCPDPAHMDVLAYHPLSVGDPEVAAAGLGVSIVDIDKLKHLLGAAQRTGRVLPASGTHLYVTELNWDSAPANPQGATRAQLTRWIPLALYLLWRGGVELATWELLRDPPDSPQHSAGLYAIDRARPLDPAGDRPRPSLAAFRFPLVLRRVSGGQIEVWALLPPPPLGRPPSLSVELERHAPGHWHSVRRVAANGFGILDAHLDLRGRSPVRLVVPRFGQSSLAATIPRPRRRFGP
jgi:hypothetical protein